MARKLIDRLTGKQSAEDVIRGLEKTKADLEAKLPSLEAAKAAALDERREALISGVEAGHAANRARQAEDDLAAVADALAEVERRLTDAVARRDAEAAQAEREAVAKGLEDSAKAIVAAAKDMAAAVEAVAKAHARMQLAVSAKAAPQVMANRESLSPVQFADGVLLEALVAALPDIGVRADLYPAHYTRERTVEGRSAADAGAAAAERLRDIATEVRDGHAGALAEWRASGPRIHASEPPAIPVHPSACFSYVDHHGQARRVTPLDCYLPEPVAVAAVAKGLAEDAPSIATQTARNQWERKREATPAENLFDRVEVTDLGVDLRALAEAEEERQRTSARDAEAVARAELERRAA
ncbi:hypothetical protein ACFOWB_02450 [Chenggangzhangella methanolivorans]|uniref:hypothetical protein n=1 Tax=Chenggangzhangella methanolivorans TaxID=1437009 RepID=UPI00360DDA56